MEYKVLNNGLKMPMVGLGVYNISERETQRVVEDAKVMPVFCQWLYQNGVKVLGIADAPYDSLQRELKKSLTEYYRVNSLENYDEVYRAVAYFAFRYGRIDWIESNNEYWLEQDARLRTDFNVTTGLQTDRIRSIKEKSEMKKYYAKGDIPTARTP